VRKVAVIPTPLYWSKTW